MANREEDDGKERRLKRRKENDRKSFVVYIFFVILLMIVIMVMSIFVLFFTQQMNLEGEEYHSVSETVDWIKEDVYTCNTLYLWVKYNYTEAELPVYLNSLEVELELPWRVKLIMVEKAMIGGIELSDKYAYFDSDGIVVYESETMLEDVPLVEGMEVENTTLYEKVPVDDDDIFENVITVTSALDDNQIEIDSLSCGTGASIILVIGNVTVQLGDDDLVNKIIQIPAVLEQIGDQEGVLYLENFDVNDGTISFVRKNAEN